MVRTTGFSSCVLGFEFSPADDEHSTPVEAGLETVSERLGHWERTQLNSHGYWEATSMVPLYLQIALLLRFYEFSGYITTWSDYTLRSSTLCMNNALLWYVFPNRYVAVSRPPSLLTFPPSPRAPPTHITSRTNVRNRGALKNHFWVRPDVGCVFSFHSAERRLLVLRDLGVEF